MSNFHSKAFDQGTKTKLSIYKQYLETCIPTFIHGNWKNINIFDFFCGPGVDSEGVDGSPIIAIKCIEKHKTTLLERKVRINCYFSDSSKEKIKTLKNETEKYKALPINLNIESGEFIDLFTSYESKMKQSANLIFVDQTGIKHVTPEILQKVSLKKNSDFLFFSASSYLKRFAETEAFENYFPNANILKTEKHSNIHRAFCDFYKDYSQVNSNYFLYPFSIKKGSNIYGLIFGTSHPKGAYKFMDVCWKMDSQTGQANFNIDQDINSNEIGTTQNLFPEDNIPTKIRKFEANLEHAILNKRIENDREIILFALRNGCLPRHAKEKVNNLINQKIIDVNNDKLRFSEAALSNAPRYFKIIKK